MVRQGENWKVDAVSADTGNCNVHIYCAKDTCVFSLTFEDEFHSDIFVREVNAEIKLVDSFRASASRWRMFYFTLVASFRRSDNHFRGGKMYT